MAWLKRFSLLMLLSFALCQGIRSQGYRYDNFVVKPLAVGGLQAVSGALITVCTSAGTGTPCTPKVTNIYSDEALTTPIVGTGGAGTTNSDTFGNYGFYIAPGSYIITVTGSGIASATTKVTLPGAFAGNINDILVVDGVKYATCDAAVTAAGATHKIIIVPSTYSGAACSTIPTPNNIQVWYFNAIDPLVQSGVFWNTTSATPVNAWLRPQVNFPSPAGNALSIYSIARFSGTIPGNSAMDAVSSEAQSVGTITSVAAGTKLQGLEDVVTLASTGGTWPDIRAAVFYAQDIPSNTTNATNTSAIFVPTMSKTGTGNYGTLVGAIFNKQTAGNVANWAMQSFGSSLFSFNAANEKLFISGDSFSNSNVIDIADTHAGGHTWDIGEMQNVAHLSFRDITQTGGPAWSFLVTGTANVEGILSHANTANRTYTFPDSSGNVPLIATGDTVYGTYRVTADFTLAGNTSLQAITGLSWTMPANTALNVGFSCHLLYSQATAAVADQFGIQDVTVAPTSLMAKAQAYISTSTFTAANVPALTTTTATPIVTFTPSAITTIWNADIDGMIEQPSNASTSVVQIMAQQSNAADLLTVKRGSFCRVW